jgi:hypothetical protein
MIHIEVQATYDAAFAERMFQYNVAAHALYNREVVSLAVLGDDNPGWRPSAFTYGRWGCRTGIEFLVVKLLDYGDSVNELQNSANPFSAVVLAHLQSRATRSDPLSRRQWKIRIVKELYRHNWTADDIRELFRIIDWILDLPDDLQQAFRGEIHQYEEENSMPYVTSIERLARNEGRQQGIREGLLEGIKLALEEKFGRRGGKLLQRIQTVEDPEDLRELTKAIMAATQLEDVRKRLK